MPSLYPHEVRKVAQGAGAASGFAGFFFPSLRARGLGEEKPVPPYSAIVYKEGDEVRAEDWKGRKIASGEAGVDDASVIQGAINTVESSLAGSKQEEVPKIMFSGAFVLKETVKITKMLHLEGGKFDIQTPLGFEVFNGNTADPDPQYIGFERITIVGNKNDAFALRYCSNWRFNNVRMFDVKRGLILERTWGDNQIMIASEIIGKPASGEGLIHAITPENGHTNSFTIIGSTFWCDADGAAVFKFETQANGQMVSNLAFYDVYTEGYGDFFAGDLKNSEIRIINVCLKGNGYIFNLTKSEHLDISIIGWQGNLFFDDLRDVRIRIGQLSPKRKDVPLLAINKGVMGDIIISNAKGSVNSDVDYIRIGEAGQWYDSIFIRNSRFLGEVGGRSVIAFGDSGRPFGCKVINCEFRNVNYAPSYPSCYALYYQGKKQIVENCGFWELNKYEVANNLEGFVFKGIKIGNAKFENSGAVTFSGDGTTKDFEIGAHNLVVTDPSKIVVKVSPVSQDAIDASPCNGYVDPNDNTKIRVKFDSAPASGSDNVKITWEAIVI